MNQLNLTEVALRLTGTRCDRGDHVWRENHYGDVVCRRCRARKEIEDMSKSASVQRGYGSRRVGCRECGDEFWDSAPGDKCPGCGEALSEISPNR